MYHPISLAKLFSGQVVKCCACRADTPDSPKRCPCPTKQSIQKTIREVLKLQKMECNNFANISGFSPHQCLSIPSLHVIDKFFAHMAHCIAHYIFQSPQKRWHHRPQTLTILTLWDTDTKFHRRAFACLILILTLVSKTCKKHRPAVNIRGRHEHVRF